MPRKLIEDARPNPPTAKQMRDFAKRFSLDEWLKICRSQKFLDTFTKDIESSKLLAELILSGKDKGLL